MKKFSELTTDERINFATKVMGIDEDEIHDFIEYANILFDYGALDAYELDTEQSVSNKILDILIDKDRGLFCLEDAYMAIKEIVDKINAFEELYKDFDIQNALDFADEICK